MAKKIIEYALFDLEPPPEYSRCYKIHQLNRNASYFLGDCGEGFADYCENMGNDKQQKNLFLNETKQIIMLCMPAIFSVLFRISLIYNYLQTILKYCKSLFLF